MISAPSSVETFLGRFNRLPSMSTSETASGESPSTALATRLVTACTFWVEIWAPGLSFTMMLALAGCC